MSRIVSLTKPCLAGKVGGRSTVAIFATQCSQVDRDVIAGSSLNSPRTNTEKKLFLSVKKIATILQLTGPASNPHRQQIILYWRE